MSLAIPVSRLQRDTKEVLAEASNSGYKYVVNHNEGVIVMVNINLFEKMKTSFENEQKKKEENDKKWDSLRGSFGKSKLSSVQLQKEALKLWMKD